MRMQYTDCNRWYDQDVSSKRGGEVSVNDWPISSITLLYDPQNCTYTPEIAVLYAMPKLHTHAFQSPIEAWWVNSAEVGSHDNVTFHKETTCGTKVTENISTVTWWNYFHTAVFWASSQDYFLLVNLWRIMVITHKGGDMCTPGVLTMARPICLDHRE